jgi:hypothetical protein
VTYCHDDNTEKPDMAVFWLILFGFTLFCVGVVVWVIGIGIRIYECEGGNRRLSKVKILPPLAHEDQQGQPDPH